jgi:cytochrome oxidase Cu insertion factor (SCO1/SenC/PrrC family)
MKTITIQLTLVALLLSSAFVSSAEAIDPGPTKYKNLFTLKTDKEFIGAQVEVYNSTGQLITSNSLQKRKMVIDFGDAHLGTYTIRIVKGDELQEFKYVKK